MKLGYGLARLCAIGLVAVGTTTSAGGGHLFASTNIAEATEAAKPADELDTRLNLEFHERVRPLLSKYCGDCHMGDNNEAGVNLEDYQSIDLIREHASSWNQVRGVIRADAMPPPDVMTVEEEDKKFLVDWIESALTEIDCNCEVPTPVVTLRRLNQYEYDNTVRTLLNLPEVKPSKDFGFVSDDVGNGFDNQGEVLTLPPIVMEKYLQAADYLAKRAILTDREALRNQRYDGERLLHDNALDVPMHLAGGEYELVLRMRFGDGLPDNCYAVVTVNGEKYREFQVSTRGKNYVIPLEMKDGSNLVSIHYVSDDDLSKAGQDARKLIVEWVESKGPKDKSPRFLPPHEAIVIAYPEDKDSEDGETIGYEEACRRVFESFLARAYRRPASSEDLDRIIAICNHAKEAGFSYLEAIRYGVQASLVSPNFLFRSESFAGDGPLDGYALATRLSYFLWSDMPDEELMRLAATGELGDQAILKAQVERMLKSPKSGALVQGFFAQWLGLRNLSKIEIDREQHPGWNDRLRDTLIKETELFCQYLITEGSVSDITSATFTFANPRLAEFYGIPYGDTPPADLYRGRPDRRRQNSGSLPNRSGTFEKENEWIRVELPEQRLGLITQPAVLALTSNPARTSPVKRGKWVLENILGDPPPSAPPNVPSLESETHGDNATLRERLEIHRSNPSCAGCHKILDPIGLGLENFDAIGRWRDEEDGQKLEVQGELTDGSTFETPRQLVEILGKKQDQILLNLTQRMMTYALGRGLQREDRCAIEQVIGYTHSQNHSVRSIIEGIVLSDTFLQHPTISPPTSAPTDAVTLTSPSGDSAPSTGTKP